AAELLTRAQGLFELLAFMNIHAGADVSGQRFPSPIGAIGPIGIEMRRAVIENPAILAVMSPQPGFHHEFSAVIEGFDVSLKTTLGITRVNAFGPSVLNLLFDVPSRVIEPAFVKEGADLVRVRHPYHDGSGIHCQPEPGFTFAQPSPGLF